MTRFTLYTHTIRCQTQYLNTWFALFWEIGVAFRPGHTHFVCVWATFPIDKAHKYSSNPNQPGEYILAYDCVQRSVSSSQCYLSNPQGDANVLILIRHLVEEKWAGRTARCHSAEWCYNPTPHSELTLLPGQLKWFNKITLLGISFPTQSPRTISDNVHRE